jgi:hypothetical protein
MEIIDEMKRRAEMLNIDTEQSFLQWEAASRDTIEVKRCYVDITGDLVAGILLSQIIYWFLPNKDGELRTSIQRGGKRWLAKRHEDWWKECRIPERTARRNIELLEKMGLIFTSTWKFAGNPTTHISVNFDELHRLILEKRYGQSGQNGSGQSGQLDMANLARTYKEAEITAESTTENTNLRLTPLESSPLPKKKGFVLPSWVPEEAWCGYVDMRKKIKKPLTDRAAKMAIEKLDGLRKDGYDPEITLDKATSGCWRGLYPTQDARVTPQSSTSESLTDQVRRIKEGR